MSRAIPSGMTILIDHKPPEAELVPLVQAEWVRRGSWNFKMRFPPLEGVQVFHHAVCLNVKAHSIAYEVIKKRHHITGIISLKIKYREAATSSLHSAMF